MKPTQTPEEILKNNNQECSAYRMADDINLFGAVEQNLDLLRPLGDSPGGKNRVVELFELQHVNVGVRDIDAFIESIAGEHRGETN